MKTSKRSNNKKQKQAKQETENKKHKTRNSAAIACKDQFLS